MTIEARKILLVQEVLKTDNEDIIQTIENFLYQSKLDTFEKNLKPMSVEDFNEQIDKSLEDEKKSRLRSVRTLKKKIQKWS